MRAIRRAAVSPPTLVDIRANYPLGVDGSVADGTPDGKWNDPDVRGAVFAMHGRVCAYCQRLASDSRGDIEHFRPKSIYPWLMYEFTNYLLGCRVCNTNRKSNVFPLASTPVAFDRRMVTDADFLRAALACEERLLLDPAEDPVTEWLSVDWEDPICPIAPTEVANNHTVGNVRVEKTVNFFGLNVIPELVDDRFTHVNAVLDSITAWRAGNPVKENELRAMASRYRPHGWAARQVLAALAPELLPTHDEELRWYVEEMLDRLDRDDRVLAAAIATKRDRAMVKQRRDEVCWTLAALWKDPPTASAVVIDGWIDARGRRTEIKGFRDRL